MKKFTTIIFDLGGVVLNNDWHDGNQNKFDEYSSAFGITYDDMERGWNKAWSDFQLGKISEDKFWAIFLKTANSKNNDIEKAKTLWKKYVVENESMLTLLYHLKKNYKLGALTTISKEWLDYKSKKYNFDSLFSTVVSSGYSGLAKPNPEIYKTIIDNLKVSPNECIFIDDSASTLPPAKKLGIHTILFTSQSELEKEFVKLKVF